MCQALVNGLHVASNTEPLQPSWLGGMMIIPLREGKEKTNVPKVHVTYPRTGSRKQRGLFVKTFASSWSRVRSAGDTGLRYSFVAY